MDRENNETNLLDLPFDDSCCWYCNIWVTCKRCYSRKYSFNVLCLASITNCIFRWYGIYPGGNFNRKGWDKLIESSFVPAGRNKLNNTFTRDFKIPNLHKGFNGKQLVRLYNNASKAPSPILVFFHGGGFIMGDCRSDISHAICNLFCERGFMVVSVNYRLAPEYPFPAAIEDSFNALEWIASAQSNEILGNADKTRIVLSGDSAGGNLATVMSMLVRDNLDAKLSPKPLSIRIQHLALFYPTMNRNPPTASYLDPNNTAILEDSLVRFFTTSYIVEPKLLNDFRVSPLAGNLNKMPRLTCAVGKYDRLYDECKLLAAAIAADGTQSNLLEYNQPHSFMVYLNSLDPDAVDCFEKIMKDLEYLLPETNMSPSIMMQRGE